MAEVVIFGAGKIARGFLGQLLFNAGIGFAFVDANEELVGLINARRRYSVNVLGAPERNSLITGCRAYALSDAAGIAAEARGCRAIFTAMGGKNLAAAAPHILRAALAAGRDINVITCENWTRPAQLLAAAARDIAPDMRAGFAEAVVMRSAIEPDAGQLAADPLVVNVQNYWRLPIDADALIAELPSVPEFEPTRDFKGFLERKFYTYNAANGTVSYLGALLGHTHIAQAARDPRVAEVLERVYHETGAALAAKYHLPLADQMAFAAASRAKLRDEVIVDTIERNARDPMRKLGPDDRLVGSARLALRYGVEPAGLATAIAAALHYRAAGDRSAEALAQIMAEGGAERALTQVCGLSRGDELYELVLAQQRDLRDRGWIR
ncbi:MAG: hypothetical protein GX558_06410 [Clostridiales bacterium]|nr:hypothetical protein [Clostridiales bacterium]